MNRYDVLVNGNLRSSLAEEAIRELYKDGHVNRQSKCRISGSKDWQDIDECLPLLKYCNSTAIVQPKLRHVAAPEPRVAMADQDDEGRRSATSAIKAGWICFGMGSASAWIFPPAFFFYSVALIMAIVAMCTRQVNKGIILLLSSFIAMGISALLSFLLAVGLFAHAMTPLVAKLNRDLERQREIQRVTELRLIDEQKRFAQLLSRPMPAPFIPPAVAKPESGRQSRNQTGRAEPPLLNPPADPEELTGAALEREIEDTQDRLNRLMARSPAIFTPRTAPLPSAAQLKKLSKHELLKETARIERQQSLLRQSGRDLPAATADYLARLRSVYDSEGEQ